VTSQSLLKIILNLFGSKMATFHDISDDTTGNNITSLEAFMETQFRIIWEKQKENHDVMHNKHKSTINNIDQDMEGIRRNQRENGGELDSSTRVTSLENETQVPQTNKSSRCRMKFWRQSRCQRPEGEHRG
jgi:hypothetical protein